MKKFILLIGFALLFITNPVLAQDKVLAVDDYDKWSRIVGTELSNNGNWMAYGLRPNGGDDTLYVKSLSGNQQYDIPFAGNTEFSDDSRWAAYLISPDEDTREELNNNNKPVYRKAELLNLQTGEKKTVNRADDMTFSNGGAFWAVHREKPESDDSNHDGSDLILHNLNDGTSLNLGNVSEFAFNKRADMLAYLVDANEQSGNGVFVLDLQTYKINTIDTDSAIYEGLVWDDEDIPEEQWDTKGTKLAVLKGQKADSLVHRTNSLIVAENLDGSLTTSVLDPAKASGFPEDMVISENRNISWTENGEKVLFGIREQEPDIEMSRDTIPNVDVWHWKDDRIQTVQMQQANRDRNFTYVSVFQPENNRFTRLTDEDMRELNISENNDYMVGRDEKPYISDINWGVSPADLYRVDLNTGERSVFAEKVKRPLGYSPDGRFYLYQQASEQDTVLIVYDLHEDTNTNISDAAPVQFSDSEHPYPHENPPYGTAGWTEDGDHVIVNHKYDLWMLALDGSEATNITQGMGEENEIIFRYETLEDEEYIDTNGDLLLTAFGEWTKKDGFYRLSIGDELEPLIFEDASFGNPEKADQSDRVILTRQTFVDFPDYYATNTDFSNLEKVTDANPQQADYAWGDRRLVNFENGRGDELQGTLTLPANYEPGEQYPTVVYFYEKMSDRHHQYSMPTYDDRPHMSTYASNGYMVFMPDILFEEGRPGTSSLDGITSAVEAIIDEGYADPDKIGLQGHSWGGYQSSFIVTQTDIFQAVVTGAPPTNLTSFYNNIYGSSGTNHHGIMEIGQVRMGRGVTPWTNREDYQRENPMYHVPDIETPFMILHGTEDGAVDWSQGLEFYNAARRMGKEVIFLSYPGEGHHLGREANQKDFLIRMKEYFDHHLKGEEAPKWMREGIPHLEKLYEKAD